MTTFSVFQSSPSPLCVSVTTFPSVFQSPPSPLCVSVTTFPSVFQSPPSPLCISVTTIPSLYSSHHFLILYFCHHLPLPVFQSPPYSPCFSHHLPLCISVTTLLFVFHSPLYPLCVSVTTFPSLCFSHYLTLCVSVTTFPSLCFSHHLPLSVFQSLPYSLCFSHHLPLSVFQSTPSPLCVSVTTLLSVFQSPPSPLCVSVNTFPSLCFSHYLTLCVSVTTFPSLCFNHHLLLCISATTFPISLFQPVNPQHSPGKTMAGSPCSEDGADCSRRPPEAPSPPRSPVSGVLAREAPEVATEAHGTSTPPPPSPESPPAETDFTRPSDAAWTSPESESASGTAWSCHGNAGGSKVAGDAGNDSSTGEKCERKAARAPLFAAGSFGGSVKDGDAERHSAPKKDEALCGLPAVPPSPVEDVLQLASQSADLANSGSVPNEQVESETIPGPDSPSFPGRNVTSRLRSALKTLNSLTESESPSPLLLVRAASLEPSLLGEARPQPGTAGPLPARPPLPAAGDEEDSSISAFSPVPAPSRSERPPVSHLPPLPVSHHPPLAVSYPVSHHPPLPVSHPPVSHHPPLPASHHPVANGGELLAMVDPYTVLCPLERFHIFMHLARMSSQALEAQAKGLPDAVVHPAPSGTSSTPNGVAPKPNRLDPTLSGVDPNLRRIDPTLSRVDPEPNIFDPALSRVDPKPNRSDPTLSRVDPKPNIFDPTLSGVDQNPSRSDPTLSAVDQNPSRSDPTLSAVDQNPSRFDPTLSGVDQNPSRFDPSLSGVDQNPSRFDPSLSGVDLPHPLADLPWFLPARLPAPRRPWPTAACPPHRDRRTAACRTSQAKREHSVPAFCPPPVFTFQTLLPSLLTPLLRSQVIVRGTTGEHLRSAQDPRGHHPLLLQLFAAIGHAW